MKILGISEEGRENVIGPTIIAGVITDDLDKLFRIGNLDCKISDSLRVRELKNKIDKFSLEYVVKCIYPAEIDKSNLLSLELESVLSVVNEKLPDIIFIDILMPPKLSKDFASKIRSKVQSEIQIIFKNKNSNFNNIVTIASILAKSHMIDEMEKIKKCWGDFGCGHLKDKKTVDFLREWYDNNGNFPKYVRKSCVAIKSMFKNNKPTMFDLIDEQ